jgi:hypothetical protein
MDQNELPLEPRHLGVPSGVSKMISNPMVRSVQTCTYIAPTLTLSPNGPKRDSKWPTHQEFHWVRPRWLSSLWNFRHKTTHLSCVKVSTIQTDSSKLPLEPRHLGLSSGASKMISEPMVHSAQTVHLYCTDTNFVSKRTKTRFHMTHIT